MSEQFFATCPRGLETLLAAELRTAGADLVNETAGGAKFSGGWDCCYRANLESRIATRILWRIAAGAYSTEQDIYRLALDQPWPTWFDAERTLRVSVSAIRSPLNSLDYVTLRVKDAVCDRFRRDRGRRPNVETHSPDLRVHAFLTENSATLYLDASGEPLYRRGFKQAKVGAPLKENLAAGILMLTGWRPEEPLLDPMCGSATFLLEAAQMALDIAPGLGRRFALERWRTFDRILWQRLVAEHEARRRPMTPLAIYGSDRDVRQIGKARENLAAAGLDRAVKLQCADLIELSPPAPAGVLIANPPYGVRQEDRQALDQLYPRVGDALKRRFAGWRCYFFSADKELAKRIGLRASRRQPLFNGALECRLYEYRIVSGALRDAR